MSGHLVQLMMKEARAKDTNARLRIAVIRARGLVPERPSGDVFSTLRKQ